MASICLALHVHVPHVLRRYSVFDRGIHYFDNYRSRDLCRRYARLSLLPTNRILLGLLRHFGGRFRVSCSISGAALDLLTAHAPDTLESFRQLERTGCVEFLATPQHNSLAFPHSSAAFDEQVERYQRRLHRVFGVTARVFRNTALIYADSVADRLAELGFSGMISHGAGPALRSRPVSRIYAAGEQRLPILLRNDRLTGDVTDRFADRSWDQWPLTAPRFAEWLARFEQPDEVVALMWDYATFGLRHPEDTGIFDFLKHLPDKILQHPQLSFATASEAIERHAPDGDYRSANCIAPSEEHNLLANWQDDPLQAHAIASLYQLEGAVRAADDSHLLEDWRRLQDARFFQAMRMAGTRDAPAPFMPAAGDSSYDAYINYMNILDSVRARSGAVMARPARAEVASTAS